MMFGLCFIVININLHGDKPLQTVLFFLKLNLDLLVFFVAVLQPPLDAYHLMVMVTLPLHLRITIRIDQDEADLAGYYQNNYINIYINNNI